MADTKLLRELTVQTFRTNAISSVLLIDDKFPKHSQVRTAGFQSADADICLKLYEDFNKLGLVCDVENDIARVKENVTSHIRKSDLLVLDLHLDGTDDSDPSASIDVLKTLADSDQFNLVVVYTAEKRLDVVGRKIAGELKGAPETVELPSDEIEDELEVEIAGIKESNVEIPEVACVDYFLLGKRSIAKKLGGLIGHIAKELKDLKQYRNYILCKLAQSFLKDTYGVNVGTEKSRNIFDGNFESKNPWFACDSVFVVIANKAATKPEEGALVSVLDNALAEWNPGVVRCLLSEIQNCIVKTGSHFHESIESDLLTQLGWLYHAKQESKVSDEHLAIALSQLTDRIMGALQTFVDSDERLKSISKQCLNVIEDKEDPKDRIKELCVANGVPSGQNFEHFAMLHSLNQFLSSKDFDENRRFITTGTVLRVDSLGEDGWWLCVEPSCDTVPEQQGDNQFIRLRMLRLQKTGSVQKALEHATHGRYLFLEYQSDKMYFDSRDGNKLNLFEVYVRRDEQITREDGVPPRVRFRQMQLTNRLMSWKDLNAEPFAQLREANANRLLHEAGHAQSRIGVDFINCSESDLAALNPPEKKKK